MEILMAAAELSPYVRASTAADVVAALSKVQRQLGHEVTIALPRFAALEQSGLLLARRLTPLSLPRRGDITVYDGQLSSGVKLVLFDLPGLGDRTAPYAKKTDQRAEAECYGTFAHAVRALVDQRRGQDAPFDVVHLHDWGAGLVAAIPASKGARTPTVLTIHDPTRDGVFSAQHRGALGLDDDAGALPDGRVGVLAAAIAAADAVTAPSSSAAVALADETQVGPTAVAVNGRKSPVIGIPSGIDYALYNPSTDAALPSRYDAEDIGPRGNNKTALVRELGLELDLERPLLAAFGVGDRDASLSPISKAALTVLRQKCALVVVGTATDAIVKKLATIAEERSDSFAHLPDDADALKRRVAASADALIVPPKSGAALWHLVGQRYGAIPIARAVPLVDDAIVDCDSKLETGTGFLYDDATAKGVGGAVGRAVGSYGSPAWWRLVRRVMHLDVGWDRPARRYIQTYSRLG